MEGLNFEEKVKKFNEVVKEIPSALNIVDGDKKKFDVEVNKYFDIPENIKDKKNKEEIIDYFTDKIIFIMEKRKGLEWKYPEGIEKEEREIIDIEIKELSDARKYQKNFLGDGNVGCVYKTKFNPNTCLKYFKSLDNPLIKNDLYGEYLMHERVYGVCEKNQLTLKAPAPRHMVRNIDKLKSFFSMETVQGFSFRDIFEDEEKLLNIFDGNLDELKKLYEKITNPDFLKLLQNDLRVIHKEAGIIHGDIHAGNLMLSKDKDIYLIDFGNSIDTNIVKVTDSDYEKVENVKDHDLLAVENLLRLLSKTLESIFDKGV